MGKSKHKGYEALKTSMGPWSDRSHHPIEIYRTEIVTPYDLGLPRERLAGKLQADLGDVIPEIDIYPKKECDRRAFRGDRPYLIGCMASKDWRENRWTITLITREDFIGF